MIYANNHTEIQVLNRIEESLMDIVGRAQEILNRRADVSELRAAWLEINQGQKVWEAKLDEILRLHNKRHEEFQACFTRCRGLISDLEAAEDLVQHESFRLLDRCEDDVEFIRALGVATNETHTSWVRRNLQGLKGLFSREKVKA